jgi:hypothetical protein
MKISRKSWQFKLLRLLMSKKKVKEPKRRNLVAKNAITFNKYKVQPSKQDKQKHGKRKHRNHDD